jgi:hypothetical protein
MSRDDPEKFKKELVKLSNFLRISGFGLLFLAIIAILLSENGSFSKKYYSTILISMLAAFGSAWLLSGIMIAKRLVMFGNISHVPITLNTRGD